MTDREIRNAKIKSTSLGNDDRGPSFWLHLDYGGSGQGFGGYMLGGRFTHYVIIGILDTLGVRRWEDLPGTPIRVDADNGKVYRIGNLLKDEWFDPSAFDKAQL